MMEDGKKKMVKKIEEKLEKVVESVASKEVITFKAWKASFDWTHPYKGLTAVGADV